MNVWCHLPTIFGWRRYFRIFGIIALCVAFITTLLLANPTEAAKGVNQTLSFQGRLLKSTGGIVDDGYYNMEFRIYQDGNGTTAGDTGGALKWTEDYLNKSANAGVRVVNGFFSINLGSITPFGNSVDWNQDTLWLSMNVAGTASDCTTFDSGSCLADGEMLPMKRITSSPYALNAGKLGGIDASGFIQNTLTPQTANLNITGSGQMGSLITSSIDSTSIEIGSVQNTTLTIGNADQNQTINIGTNPGSTNKQIAIGSLAGTGNVLVASGDGGVSVQTSGDFKVGDGSSDSLVIHHAGDVDINTSTNIDGSLTVKGDSSVIAVLSPDQSASLSLGWDSQSQTGLLASTGNTLSLQGGGLNLLTATNNGGVSSVGIGNSASSGYALDVTGDINSSSQYRISGNTVLTSSSLAFGGTSSSSITSASGESLLLNSDSDVQINVDGKASASFNSGNVQIGDGSASSALTLLTLDNATIDPISGAQLGSMYYDSATNAIRCYNGTTWGDCNNLPDTFVALTPSYAGAVTQGDGSGAMTTGFCSDDLDINDGSNSQIDACGTNETYNYYRWTSSSTTAQDNSIFVTYQLPDTFDNFVSDTTSLEAHTDNTDATVKYQIYRKVAAGGLQSCGSSITVSDGAQANWLQATSSGSDDPSSCNFSAGDTMLIKITTTASNDANAFVGPLSFAFSNKH